MKRLTLGDLQESLADKSGFRQLPDYEKFCAAFLAMMERTSPRESFPRRIEHYIFYQYRQGARARHHPPA
jgi:hypothetical protein